MMLARLPAGVFAHGVRPPTGGRFCVWCWPSLAGGHFCAWSALAQLVGVFAHGVVPPAGGRFCIYGIQKKVLIF